MSNPATSIAELEAKIEKDAKAFNESFLLAAAQAVKRTELEERIRTLEGLAERMAMEGSTYRAALLNTASYPRKDAVPQLIVRIQRIAKAALDAVLTAKEPKGSTNE